MRFHAALSIFALALAAAPARADILFLDFNINDQEIEAARQAATERGERLVVLPDLTPEKRDEVKRRRVPLDNVTDRYSVLYIQWAGLKKERDKTADPGRIRAIDQKTAELIKKMDPLEKEENRLREEIQSFIGKDLVNGRAIDQVLASFHRQKKIPSGLILSGHHSNFFWGIGGQIDPKRLQRAFKKYPELEQGLSGVYLWGCYSETQDENAFWYGLFPNLQMVAGYEAVAPKGSRPANLTYLHEMLVKEAHLTSISDASRLYKEFRQIPGTKETTAAFCTNGIYVTNEGPIFAETINVRCPASAVQPVQRQYEEVFLRYLRADDPGFESPPRITGDSPLRTFYSLARRSQHCSELAPIKAELERVSALIGYSDVVSNFTLFYAKELSSANQALQAAGVRASDRIPDLTRLSRKGILAEIRKLSRQVSHLHNKTLSLMLAHMQRMLGDLQCIPHPWREAATRAEHLNPPSSACIQAPAGTLSH